MPNLAGNQNNVTAQFGGNIALKKGFASMKRSLFFILFRLPSSR
jgi:hypothetical protein